MPPLPTLRDRSGRLLLAALVALHVTATAAIGLRAGSHIEEIGGLLTSAPQRLGTGAAAPWSAEEGWRLRASQHLPVWGLERGPRSFTPLMVDGHIGAVPYTLHRLAAHVGGLPLARALSWCFGGLLLLATWLLGRAIGGLAVAWLATLLAALSPQAAFMHHWAHAEEQLSAGLPLFAVLAILRHRSRPAARWLTRNKGASGPDHGLAPLPPSASTAYGVRLARRLVSRLQLLPLGPKNVVFGPHPTASPAADELPVSFGAVGGAAWHLILAAAMLGLAMAAKNTAAWVVLSMLLTGWWLDVLPTCRRRTWLLAAAVAAVPLLPQAVFVVSGADPEAFWRRLATLPGPDSWIELDRLAFFAQHFATSFGALGDYVSSLTSGGEKSLSSWSLAAGVLALLATLALCLVSIRRTTQLPTRLLGCGIGLVGLQYLAFYYEGMSLFGLLGPWIPLVIATATIAAMNWLSERLPRVGALRWLPALLALVFACSQGVQQIQLQTAFDAPRHGIFDLDAQRRLVHESLSRSDTLWTTTYDLAGVPELLSGGALAGRHLFPIFWDVVSSTEETPALYDEAWRQALDLLPAGDHLVVLVPRPAAIEVSPCRNGAWIAERLPVVATERGITLERVADITTDAGAATYRLVRLRQR